MSRGVDQGAARPRSRIPQTLLVAGMCVIASACSAAPPASPSVSVTPSPASDAEQWHVTEQISLGPVVATALAESRGGVWVTIAADPESASGKGEARRYDETTGRELGSWSIGGDPASLSVAPGTVWVANGPGDGRSLIADANTVVQLDSFTGAVERTYHVQNPRTLIATPSGAIVVADATQNGPVMVEELAAGSAATVATIPGTAASESRECHYSRPDAPGTCLLVSTEAGGLVLYVSESAGARPVGKIPATGNARLACGPASCYVAVDNANDGGVFRVAAPGSPIAGPWGGRFPNSICAMSDQVWTLTNQQGATQPAFLQAFDGATGRLRTPAVSLPPGDAHLLTASASGALWVIVGQSLVKVTHV